MGSTSKRQQTMAKRAREQSIREKRERKAEKKAARAAAKANGLEFPGDATGDGEEATETPTADVGDGSESAG